MNMKNTWGDLVDNGFITLHRKIMEWEWYTDGNTYRLFTHLLLKANHEPKKWHGIEVNRGQLITGRKVLAEELNLSERQIRTAITHLKSTNEVTIKATNKYSLITVVNYDLYQTKKKRATNKKTVKLPTDDQQTTTNNNDNNNNNKRYSDLFEYWNEKAPHNHPSMTDNIFKQLNKLTIDESKDVKIAIDRYCKAYNDKSYFYNNKWTLDKFIKQGNGYKEWLDDGSRWVDYSPCATPVLVPNGRIIQSSSIKKVM